ncbi:magnesium-transporting ATPase (P-type) [Acetoanaerobium pronyense]|uniref:Magnesium-transporting ATPase (P-type) n=1 Tax=Acetoanaerobium pronyense TaxID=1482736 RepID=A0ABS4KID4_9FIRM|nr:magnesium-transporting ATPase (P-type) [Acetoanaerobium pronyense]
MSEKLIYKIFYGLMLMIQGLLISGSFMLSHLAKSKAGVMRHIYTKRLVYETGFLYSDIFNLFIYVFLFISILILTIYLYNKKTTNLFEKFQAFIYFITSLFTLSVMKNDFFISFLSHPYILIACFLSCVIQFLFLILLLFEQKKSPQK